MPSGMTVERDLAIPMDDGIALRADLFRPEGSGKVPVIMTLGPYGKGVKYQGGMHYNGNGSSEHIPRC